MDYDTNGYLPEAMINYLARLGWSHGNDELFSREQLVEWFDTRNLTKSAAQWDPKKLNWVNAHYIKESSDAELAALVAPRIAKLGGDPKAVDLPAVMGLLKDRAETLNQLADGAMLFARRTRRPMPNCSPHMWTIAHAHCWRPLPNVPAPCPTGQPPASNALIKALLAEHGVKMPKLGIPLRVVVTGHKQTPSIGAVLAILGRECVLERLAAA